MARIKGALYENKLFSQITKSIEDEQLKKPAIEGIIKLAKEKGVTTRPFDIETFIQYCGISVIYEDLGDYSGYILPRPSGWLISVHQYDSPERQRFTLAHELMHYLYDKDFIEKTDGKYTERITFRDKDEEKNKNDIERQANLRASNLLMPEEDFRNEYNQNHDLEKIGKLFGVSKSAAWVRAKMLNLIG